MRGIRDVDHFDPYTIVIHKKHILYEIGMCFLV